MPGQSGAEVLTAWRAGSRSLPVLVLTAREAWADKVSAFKAGADDYLIKPFRIEELMMRLRATVRRGTRSRASPIVGNLLDNAARHARAFVRVTAFRDSRRIIMEIEDDGPGVPVSKREQAMQPGIRLDESPQGDCFGLAIVRDLIALHGGELSLREAPHGGLHVRVSIIPAAFARSGPTPDRR